MSFQPGAVGYVQSFGTRPENIEVPHYDVRIPSTMDWNYPIGKEWIFIGNSIWKLLSISSSRGVNTANWAMIFSNTTTVITGDLTLATVGGKINIATGPNASVGVTANMVGGVVTVLSTAITAASIIQYSRKTLGGTAGHIAISAQAAGTVTFTSSSPETSTLNYLIIN